MSESLEILIFFIVEALIITIIIELLMLFVQREKNYRVYLFSILINVITNVSLNVGIQFVELVTITWWSPSWKPRSS